MGTPSEDNKLPQTSRNVMIYWPTLLIDVIQFLLRHKPILQRLHKKTRNRDDGDIDYDNDNDNYTDNSNYDINNNTHMCMHIL